MRCLESTCCLISNGITTAFEEVAGALEGIESVKYVYDGWPTKLNTPCAVLIESEPFIVQGVRPADWDINITVLLVTKYSSSRTVVRESLYGMIADVLDEVGTAFAIGDVETPSAFESDGNQYLGTSFTTKQNYEKESL